MVHSRGAFHLGATREGGDARLVVFGAPGRNGRLQRQALEKLEQAHRLVSHPRIAPVAGSGEHEGVPFVSFDCDVRADLGTALGEVRRAGHLIPYAQGDGFIAGLRETLQAAHRVSIGGKPMCIGALTYSNVLFCGDGRHWLLGFGHNVMTHDETGSLQGSEPIFQAPELVVGGVPSPSADFVGLILMMRSIASVADLVPAVARAIVGNTLPEDLELLQSLLQFEWRVMAAHPSKRATIDEAIKISDRIRALLGVEPDLPGFERHAAAALARLLPDAPRSLLRVGLDATRIEAPDGTRHQLGGRTALRRVLLALVGARLQSPGQPLSLEALIEAGWPGEHPDWEAGVNRVYVLLSELRRLGLRRVLQRHNDGYRLDPALQVQLDTSLPDERE
jgi:hypothetical protein